MGIYADYSDQALNTVTYLSYDGHCYIAIPASFDKVVDLDKVYQIKKFGQGVLLKTDMRPGVKSNQEPMKSSATASKDSKLKPHEHDCAYCGRTYYHTHFFNKLRHKQHDSQCPFEDC
jgi:hypothetical protein